MEANDYDPHKYTKKKNAIDYLSIGKSVYGRRSR